MADGRDDRVARGPKRGSKLRYQGSNPTGNQTESFTPEYVGDDPSIQYAYLNENVKMSEDQYGRDVSSKKLRNKGLIIKQPLS